MHTLCCAVIKRNCFLGLVVAGALALVSVPASADRITVEMLKKGLTRELVRGHLNRTPTKSNHSPSLGSQILNQGGPRAAVAVSTAAGSSIATPPVFPFFQPSSRSGSVNYGFMVGTSPFSSEVRGSSVKTFLVPVVIVVHQVASDFGVDANGNLILTGITDQDATFDPTQPSPACLGKTNNVPFKLAVQSPMFQNHHWVWGGTDLGNTQYGDAFQRANFWQAMGEDRQDYHLRLSPVVTTAPIVLDFPIGTGIALPATSQFAGYSNCAPTVLVDFSLFDALLDYEVLPQLRAEGVNASNFPIFTAGNMLLGQVIDELPVFNAQAAGYHSLSSVDPAQTYGVVQFGDENFFTWPDAVVLSHEIGEWMNDPTGTNYVTAYGPSPFCQGNYETGDVLSGIFMPPVTGRNGYTYTLQELAFFSYFYGAPSLGANGWYSNNNTLTTDAGPACSPF